MAMRRSHNLHTIYKAEVIEHAFPPDLNLTMTKSDVSSISHRPEYES